MKVIEQGFKCIYSEEAIVYENVAPSVESEFKRHIRDATGHYISILHLKKLLNLFKEMSSLIFWSHRIIRWLVSFFLIIIFILNTKFINNDFYFITFLLQSLFYILAFLDIYSIILKSYLL